MVVINGKTFLTVADMSKILDREKGAIKMQLIRAKIKPIAKDAIYDKSALEAIRNVAGKGRPRKAEPDK